MSCFGAAVVAGADSTLPSAPTAPAARRYRNLTKHSPASVRQSGHRLDWANKPSLYRTYPGAEIVALPAPIHLTRPALEAIADPSGAPGAKAPPLDLEQLGTILFLGGGISGRRPSGRGDIRTTASAGALYPNEIYVVSGALPGLTAGLYHYDARHERLSQLRSGDWRSALALAAADERVRSAPATLVLTGILSRSAWKYRERAYRHLYWDGGMKLAHILAGASAAGQPATLLTAFVDRDVDRLLGIDGRAEASMALVPLGNAAKAAGPSPSALAAIKPPDFTPAEPIAGTHEYPEALRYHAASTLPDAEAVRRQRTARVAQRKGNIAVAAVTLPPPASARSDPSLDAVVRRRRSTRRFAERPIGAAELAAMLALPSAGVPADFLALQPTLVETYVIVHAVDGVAPGAYHYRRGSLQLEPLRAGELRRVAGFLSLDQDLARDASAVLYYLADLEAVFAAFGERGYRLAELEAGLLAGRTYLAAYATGRGVSGLTFYDDEVTRFFSPHAAGLEPLLVVVVGVPAKRS